MPQTDTANVIPELAGGWNDGLACFIFRFLKRPHYGSIVIKGTGGTNTPIPNIKAPMQFRSIVNNHIEEMGSKQQ